MAYGFVVLARKNLYDVTCEVSVKQEPSPRPIATSIEDATDAKQMGYGLIFI